MAYVNIGGRVVKVVKRQKFGGYGRFRTTKSNLPEIIAEKIAADKSVKLKGVYNGNCNVTSCQAPGATWWNTSTKAYYCGHCAEQINRWSRHDEGYDICYHSREYAESIAAPFTEAYYEASRAESGRREP